MNLREQMEFMRMLADDYALKAEKASDPSSKVTNQSMERACREVYESLVVLDNVCRQTKHLQST